jgi:hypothetical protein
VEYREKIELFSIAVHIRHALASLFRFDPAIDQLLTYVEWNAAVAQDRFVELSDIELLA